ncbi:MAG: hypothetical protein M3179_04315 [Actinomycetota bacterium]|nr:hypothetical protein [Actinomycetota bacterium]
MAEAAIEHVVVLMLENRSFDHLLGFLDHPGADYPRLEPGLYSNRTNPLEPRSEAIPVTPDARHTIPLDPPHGHESVMEQLHISGRGRPRMDGFVAAYNRKASGKEPMPVVHWWRLEALVLAVAAVAAALVAGFGGRFRRLWPLAFTKVAGAGSFGLWKARAKMGEVEPRTVAPEVMRAMAPDKVPVLSTLAKEFAVCTRWHCSVPGETWPNRNFVHAATSEETVDIELGFYEAPTVFELLERWGASWRVYHDGAAQVWAFCNLWRHPDRCARWESIEAFEQHLATGDLAAYSFIEPDHDGNDSNSQHPNNNTEARGGADFAAGEALMARVYDALRRHPEVFAKTLFVITYDEHGGFYDHVPPPTDAEAPRPIGKRVPISRRVATFFIERGKVRFRFRTLGPRVPTVVVSPLIERGTVDDTLYDHSSVVATVRRIFAPGAAPLTARDAAANRFDHLASRSVPRPVEDLVDVTPPRAEPVSSEAAGVVAGAGSPDEFALQLEELARMVGAHLDAAGAPAASSLVAGNGARARGRSQPTDDVVRRFKLAAQQARQQT